MNLRKAPWFLAPLLAIAFAGAVRIHTAKSTNSDNTSVSITPLSHPLTQPSENRLNCYPCTYLETPVQRDGRRKLPRISHQGQTQLLHTSIPSPDSSLFTTYLPTDIQYDPLIQGMMTQVITSTVYQYDGDLSGEWPVMVGNNPFTITTRYTYSGVPISVATRYVGEHLTGLGLDVKYHQWAGERGKSYPNVIGEVTGMVRPDDIYIFSAHLDSLSDDREHVAPGADDNASGSVANLITAEILSQYRWGCTLRFAFWTGEEQGLRGSDAYAARSADLDENIIGVLNLDMVGYNSGDSPEMDLHARSWLTDSVTIANLFVDVVDTYNINLQPEVIIDDVLSDRSDNKSFWDEGYAAILTIEDNDDFNPNYHTTQDRLHNLDIDYFTEMVRASVGTFAHMSNCLLPEGVGFLEGYVTSSSDGSAIASATIDIDGEFGRVTTSSDQTGYYTQTLPTGVYTVTVTATNYFSTMAINTTILSGDNTTQDFALDQMHLSFLPLTRSDD